MASKLNEYFQEQKPTIYKKQRNHEQLKDFNGIEERKIKSFVQNPSPTFGISQMLLSQMKLTKPSGIFRNKTNTYLADLWLNNSIEKISSNQCKILNKL